MKTDETGESRVIVGRQNHFLAFDPEVEPVVLAPHPDDAQRPRAEQLAAGGDGEMLGVEVDDDAYSCALLVEQVEMSAEFRDICLTLLEPSLRIRSTE
jgi:hypothetical protein